MDYVDVVGVYTYRVTNFRDGLNLAGMFDNWLSKEVFPFAKGKPVYLTECGLWTETGTDFGIAATFTEDDQVNYYTSLQSLRETRCSIPCTNNPLAYQ